MANRPDIDAYLEGATKEARKDALFTEMVEALTDLIANLEEGDFVSITRIEAAKRVLAKVAEETGQ